MKTRSFKAGDYAGTGKIVLGAIGGALLSRALMAVAHDPTSTNAFVKGYLPAKRVAVAGGGFVGASIIDGKDDMSLIAKGAGYGVAIAQTLELITDLTANKVADTGTKTNKLLRKTLGLGCPETNNWGMGKTRARRRQHHLGYVPNDTPTSETPVFSSSGSVAID